MLVPIRSAESPTAPACGWPLDRSRTPIPQSFAPRVLRVASNRNQVRRSVSSIQTSDEAGGRDVTYSSHDAVDLAQAGGEVLVVVAQFRQHVLRLDVVGVVVVDALSLASYLADRAQASCRRSCEPAPRSDRSWRRSGRHARRAAGGSRGNARPLMCQWKFLVFM